MLGIIICALKLHSPEPLVETPVHSIETTVSAIQSVSSKVAPAIPEDIVVPRLVGTEPIPAAAMISPVCTDLIQQISGYAAGVRASYGIDEIFISQTGLIVQARGSGNGLCTVNDDGTSSCPAGSLEGLINDWCVKRFGSDWKTMYSIAGNGAPVLNPVDRWFPSIGTVSSWCPFGVEVTQDPATGAVHIGGRTITAGTGVLQGCDSSLNQELANCKAAYSKGGTYYLALQYAQCLDDDFMDNVSAWKQAADKDALALEKDLLAHIDMWDSAKGGGGAPPDSVLKDNDLLKSWFLFYSPLSLKVGSDSSLSISCPIKN